MRSAARRSETDAASDVREAERVLLGALLRDPRLMARVRASLSPEHFSTPIGERIFSALAEIVVQGSGPAVLARVADELGAYEWDEAAGADGFLRQLTARPAPAAALEELAREIKRMAERRDAREDLYRSDITGWAHRQAEALSTLALRPDLAHAVDWPNVIEEIRSVGRSEVGGVARRIELILVHAIKAVSSPDAPAIRRWQSEIELHVRVLASDYAPSMRRLLNIDRLWASAIREAARDLDEYGERVSRRLPATSPLALDDLLSTPDADGLVRIVADHLDRASPTS